MCIGKDWENLQTSHLQLWPHIIISRGPARTVWTYKEKLPGLRDMFHESTPNYWTLHPVNIIGNLDMDACT
jgi:hypothetical protein